MKFIRKIDSIGRWDGTATPIYEGAFSTGDILLTELKTEHNTLSIWGYETEDEKDEVLAAMALTRQHVNRLAYVMMDEVYINNLGIPLKPEEGIADGIIRKEILQRHVNLAEIDFWRLGYVAEYISKLAKKKEDHFQLSDKKVYQLIERHIRKKNIDINLVNEALQDSYARAQLKYGIK